MKDIECSQASRPDIQSIACGEARISKEVQSEQDNSFPKQWIKSTDTTYSRQAFSITNPSILDNLFEFQGITCDRSFMATSQQVKQNEQTHQGASGQNETAGQSLEFLWERMRVNPVTLSNNAALMEAYLQSSLSSFTTRHDASHNYRLRLTPEVKPPVTTDLTPFLQQQLLPMHLQNAIHYIQSVLPITSSNGMMSDYLLSSRSLQRLLLCDDDNHTQAQ